MISIKFKRITLRLSNKNFVEKADPEVVQAARDTLAEAEKQAEILRDTAHTTLRERAQQLKSS